MRELESVWSHEAPTRKTENRGIGTLGVMEWTKLAITSDGRPPRLRTGDAPVPRRNRTGAPPTLRRLLRGSVVPGSSGYDFEYNTTKDVKFGVEGVEFDAEYISGSNRICSLRRRPIPREPAPPPRRVSTEDRNSSLLVRLWKASEKWQKIRVH